MWPDLASTKELASVIDVLSAMITPAGRLLATGARVRTTANRSIGCVGRVRERAATVGGAGGAAARHRIAGDDDLESLGPLRRPRPRARRGAGRARRRAG